LAQTPLGKESEAAITYVIPIVGGVIFLVMEKDSFVRFHGMQSIVFWITVMVLWMILGFTNFFSFIIPVLFIVSFVLWLVLVYKSWLGEEWELPVLGRFARTLLAKA